MLKLLIPRKVENVVLLHLSDLSDCNIVTCVMVSTMCSVTFSTRTSSTTGDSETTRIPPGTIFSLPGEILENAFSEIIIDTLKKKRHTKPFLTVTNFFYLKVKTILFVTHVVID